CCGSLSSGGGPAATAPIRWWMRSSGSSSRGSPTGLDPLATGVGRRPRLYPSGQARSPRPPASRIHALGRIRGPACLPAAWRLIRELSGPLGDRGEVAGLDQLVGLEMSEGT